MTTANILRLTTNGEQAVNNADAGGIQVRPAFAKFGNYSGEVPAIVPTDILGSVVYQGNIHYIQVLSAASTRFTIEIPSEVEGVLGECVIYLEDGTALAHATIQPNREKVKGKALRVDLVMMLSNNTSHVIDISLSEFGSIPTVANLRSLPAPSTAMESAIGVLDCQLNVDGTYSPSIAMRFGAGGQQWGFVGWDKIYTGEVGAGNVISNGEFRVPDEISTSLPNTDLILQLINGSAAGESRKGYYDGATIQIKEAAFTELKGNETINIWIPQVSGESGQMLPPRDGVPKDWVLVRGDKKPTWAKPTNQHASSGTKLYHAPSRLRVNPIIFDGTGAETYDLGVSPESTNYIMCSLSGVTQSRDAMSISSNLLTFAEPINDELTVFARALTKEPSSGDYLHIKVAHYVGDGNTKRFKLPDSVENVNDVIVYVEKFDQNYSSFSVDMNSMEVVFTAAPNAGYTIEINAFVYEKIAGYSTEVLTFNYYLSESTNLFELPIEPESVNSCFVSLQGIHIHKNKLTLAKNKLVIGENIPEGISVEVMVFNNILSQGSPNSDLNGVVTGVIRTCKGLEVLMHNKHSHVIPLPVVRIEGDEGVKVVGEYPHFKVGLENTSGSKQASGKLLDAQTVYQGREGVLEITYPIKIDLRENDVHINANANFSAEIGPGFAPTNYLEQLQGVLGIKTAGMEEPSYDTRSRGSVTTGFSCLGTSAEDDATAYANCSRSLDIIIRHQNHKSGYVTLIAKAMIANVDVDAYQTYLGVEVSYNLRVV